MRVQRGMTQKEVGDKMGVTPQQICKWEKKPKSMSVKNLIRLCEVYECKIEDIEL
nr:MAG TPA: helix-turn-helix domain protein [Caudoviricetes sp.]